MANKCRHVFLHFQCLYSLSILWLAIGQSLYDMREVLVPLITYIVRCLLLYFFFFYIIIIRMRYITFNRLIDNQKKKELGGHGFTKNLCYSLSALSLISALLFWRIWPRTDCISSSAASHDNIYCMTNSDHNKNVSCFYYLAACTHTFSTIFKCIHSPSLPLSLPLSSLPLVSLSLTFSSITLERGRRERECTTYPTQNKLRARTPGAIVQECARTSMTDSPQCCPWFETM